MEKRKMKNLLPEKQQRRPKRDIRQPVRYQDYYTEADRECEKGGGALLTYVEVMGSPDITIWKKAI
jgi:hypothetical protein